MTIEVIITLHLEQEIPTSDRFPHHEICIIKQKYPTEPTQEDIANFVKELVKNPLKNKDFKYLYEYHRFWSEYPVKILVTEIQRAVYFDCLNDLGISPTTRV